MTDFVPVPTVSRSIAGNSTNIIISWPANITAGSVLQKSSDLLSWTNSQHPVTLNGSSNTTTVD